VVAVDVFEANAIWGEVRPEESGFLGFSLAVVALVLGVGDFIQVESAPCPGRRRLPTTPEIAETK